MSKNRCLICKYLDTPNKEEIAPEVGRFFGKMKDGTQDFTARLCKAHAAELHKLGQRRFFLKYKEQAIQTMDSDDKDFIEHLKVLG